MPAIWGAISEAFDSTCFQAGKRPCVDYAKQSKGWLAIFFQIKDFFIYEQSTLDDPDLLQW